MSETAKTLDRLLVDRLERRHVRNHLVLQIGRIARFVNIEASIAEPTVLDEHSVLEAAFATSPTYVAQRNNIMPRSLSQQPILLGEDEGVLYLLDGLQRAYSAFRQGFSAVSARIISMSLAVALGSDEPPDDKPGGKVYPLLEATKNRPVGAAGGMTETRSIVQLEAYDDFHRGRPPQTNMGGRLRDMLLYKTICAVSRELVLAAIFPRSASVAVDRREQPNVGPEDQILHDWNRTYNIPPASRWKEAANQAAILLKRFSDFTSLADLKAALRAESISAGEDQAARTRDMDVQERNILLKAVHRHKSHEKGSRLLIKQEGETAPAKNRSRTLFGAEAANNTELDINEQIILAKAFAINPTSFCFEHLRCDAIFEAYVFACLRRAQNAVDPPPFLVETFLQRQEIGHLATAGSTEHIATRMWNDVFEYYDDASTENTITKTVLDNYDKAGLVDGPLPPHLVQLRYVVL